MPFFRKGQEGLCKKHEFLNPDREFIGFRAEEVPANAYQIAKIQQLKERKAALADDVLLYINLNALTRALYMGEACFAHQAEGNQPPSDADFVLVSIQVRG